MYLATFLFTLNPVFTPKYTFGFLHPYFLWAWGNFDGVHYLSIADFGYQINENPFFPLYPIFIYFISFVTTLPLLFSGLLVSHIAFFLTLLVVFRLLNLDGYKKIQDIFGLVVIFFPTSFFYGSVYNDSLFFLLASLSIYFARRQMWLGSCIFGALATLTRLNGLALFWFILAEFLNDDLSLKKSRKMFFLKLKKLPKKLFSYDTLFRKKLLALALIPEAFLAYLVYTDIRFGNWSVVFSSMQVWEQDRVIFPPQVIWRYFKMIAYTSFLTREYVVVLTEFVAFFLYVFLIVYTYKKLRFSYFVLFFLSILIPSLTGTFQGMPRYGLHIYPFFLSLSIFLSHRNSAWQLMYFILSVLLLFIYISFFTRGYFIS